jgi:hypothetical protein
VAATAATQRLMLLLLGLLVAAIVAVVVLPPLHPAQIWALVWALAVGAYSLKLFPYLQLGVLAQVLIGFASIGFMGGALIGERLGRGAATHLEMRRGPSRMVHLPLAARIAFALTLVGLIGFLLQAVHSYGLRAALVSSRYVRQAVETGAFSVSIKYVYAAVAASVLCGACAAIGPHRRRWALAGGSAVLSTYFATGRSTVVVAAVSALCAYALARFELPSKRSFILGSCAVAIVAIGIFAIGGSLIGKTFANSELATIDSAFERHAQLRLAALPYEYMSAPIAAFGLEVGLANHLPRTEGCTSFGYICSILRHAGVDVQPVPEVRPFTAAPLKWNTYTSLDAPLLDGGPWLVVPAAILAGIVLGATWAAARRRRLLALVCYAALTPAIVTAHGSNKFTAPLLVGSMLIALGALLIAQMINRTAIRT